MGKRRAIHHNRLDIIRGNHYHASFIFDEFVICFSCKEIKVHDIKTEVITDFCCKRCDEWTIRNRKLFPSPPYKIDIVLTCVYIIQYIEYMMYCNNGNFDIPRYEDDILNAQKLLNYIYDSFKDLNINIATYKKLLQLKEKRIRKETYKRLSPEERENYKRRWYEASQVESEERQDRWVGGKNKFLSSVMDGTYNPLETKYGHIGYTTIENITSAYEEYCMYGGYKDYNL